MNEILNLVLDIFKSGVMNLYPTSFVRWTSEGGLFWTVPIVAGVMSFVLMAILSAGPPEPRDAGQQAVQRWAFRMAPILPLACSALSWYILGSVFVLAFAVLGYLGGSLTYNWFCAMMPHQRREKCD